MPMPSIPVPQYPDVPRAPGVPPMLRAPGVSGFLEATLLVSDVLSVIGFFAPSQWGIFDDGGEPVAVPDNVISVDFRREAHVSSYPVERGGFADYDKVMLPYQGRVRMSIGGNAGDRSEFLQALDDAVQSLDLYTLVMPDCNYPNMNITHYDFHREARNGATLLLVDVWAEEIRESVTTQFSDTKTPQGAAEKDAGTVQSNGLSQGVAGGSNGLPIGAIT